MRPTSKSLSKTVLVWLLSLFCPLSAFANSGAVLRVGVLGPLSGPGAELGNQQRKGLELAQKLQNSGKANRIELVFEDDHCDPLEAQSAAQKLVHVDKVQLIIGPLCSPPFLAVQSLLETAAIPFIHTSLGTPNTEKARGHFGIEGTGTVMEEQSVLSAHIWKRGFHRAAVIHFEQEWASGHAESFVKAFHRLGGEVVAKESFVNAGEGDFRSLLLRILSKRPGAIMIAAINGQTADILKQLRSIDSSMPVFAQLDVEDPYFLKSAGTAAEGLQFTAPEPPADQTRARSFKAAFRSEYGVEPSFYSLNAADVYAAVIEAKAECGAASGCLSQVLSSRAGTGLAGRKSMINGVASRQFVIKEVRGGKFIPAEK